MEQGYVIEVIDVRKKFKVYYDKGSQLKEKVLFRNRNRYEERWVLQGVSFKVKQGEAIGLIGHNGCGKSTTLKLLTKIIYPDSGEINMKGRVSSLLELGAGFHPDMSGRENIYTNASIFGLSKKEIDARMEDIVEFSEMEKFLDNPVRTYSSGMYMRLAFSVAINVGADILLIDEILAVGDVNFQAKCFNKLREIKKNGTTIVIVSHSMSQIEQICDRSIWLHEGLIKSEGVPRLVHPEYLNVMGQKRQEIAEKENARKEEREVNDIDTDGQKESEEGRRWGNGDARIEMIEMFNSEKKPQVVFATGEDIFIRMSYKVRKPVRDAVIGIAVYRSDGMQCYGTNTRIDQLPEYSLGKNGTLELELTGVDLLPGEYLVDLAIESENGIPVDYYKQAINFQMYSSIDDIGILRMKHNWKFQD